MYFDAFISDKHFGHSKIIEYCNRPFKDANHMTQVLCENYNKKVRSFDTTLWLGDCFFIKEHDKRKAIMQALNGKKILLRGNHDDRITDNQFFDMGFDYIFGHHFMGSIGNHKVRYSHYPAMGVTDDKRYLERRPPRDVGVTVIHGHTHQKTKISAHDHIHVGVDAWNYGPATYDEVLELLDKNNDQFTEK